MANTSSQSFGLHDALNQEVSKITEQYKGETIRISDTPETLLPPGSPSYDITIFCKDCSFYIDISNLQYHRAYHNALAMLQFSCADKPLDVQSLLNRRNQVIQLIKDEASGKKHPINCKKLKSIDEAYELIKNDILDVCKDFAKIPNNKVDEDVQSFSLKCSLNPKCAVGIASSVNSAWKNQMEDAKVYQDYFGDDKNKCYLAIFDGYHGTHAALNSSQKLHKFLLKEMAKFDSKIASTEARNFAESVLRQEEYELQRPETRNILTGNLHQESKIYVQKILDSSYNTYNEEMERDLEFMETSNKTRKKMYDQFSEQMRKAFRNAYLEMDQMLSCGIDESSKIRWSGTSAVTCLIHHFPEEVRLDAQVEGKIYIANVGNSKALLIKHNKPMCITKDHTPNNPSEGNRIHKRGGYITSSEKGSLVSGVLPVTRGLGNFGDKVLKDCITAEPYFKSINIDQSAQFLVLASSGVWQVFSDQEVASLLTRMLPNQQLPPSSRNSESLYPLLAPESDNCQGLLSQETADSIHSFNSQVEEINKDFPVSSHTVQKADTEENEEILKLDLAKSMAEQLACAAMLAGSTENITVLVVLLPGCGPMNRV